MTILLGCGVVGAVLFTVVWAVEGARRAGYRPTYHPISALSLGRHGWVQVTSFVVTGALMVAFAVGVWQAIGSLLSAVLLGAFGLALVASGVWTMDAVRGYPPGTPDGDPPVHSRQHRLHDQAGVVVFLSAPAACVAVALAGTLPLYSFVTAGAGLSLLAWFGTAWEHDSPHAGLVQRGLVLVDFTWIAVLGIHLGRSAP